MKSIPPSALREPRKVLTAIRVKPYSMLSYFGLVKLYDLARAAPEGALVECGVWNGGAAAMMAQAASVRPIWLFDSWEGLPDPGPLDELAAGEVRNEADRNVGDEQTVRRLMRRFPEAHLVRGWFEDTIPREKANVGPIAVLHLDCDWYDSIRLCLAELHDQVVSGGTVVVDDYQRWKGARRAVDAFAVANAIEPQLLADGSVFWRVDTQHQTTLW